MAINIGIDTYISVTDADTYVSENHISTSTKYTTWDALEDSDKEIYLKKATSKIERLQIRGMKAVGTQTLQFPRAIYSKYYRTDLPRTTIRLNGNWVIEEEVTDLVKHAQVEEALEMAVNGYEISKREKLQREGVKSYRLGDLSESFVDGISSSSRLKSDTAEELLSYYTSGGRMIC